MCGAERWEECRRAFAELAEELPDDVSYRGWLGYLAARLGEREKALEVYQWLESADQPFLQGENTLWRARIAAQLGRLERAVALLRTAVAEGANPVVDRVHFGPWLHQDAALEPLRGYPPFQELLRARG